MFNKFFAVILSVLLLFACGLFFTACDVTGSDTGSVGTSGSEASDTGSGESGDTGSGDSGSDSSGETDDVGELKAEIKAGINESWKRLLTFYPGLSKSEYEEKYNEIVTKIENATTAETLNAIGGEYSALVEEIRGNLTVDVESYKSYMTAYVTEEWNRVAELYVDLPRNEEFTEKYNGILSGIRGASTREEVDLEKEKFDALTREISDYYSRPTVEGTIQVCLNEIEDRMNRINSGYPDKITPDIQSKINAWYNKFYGSKTVEEVYENQRGFVAYLDELIASFEGSSGEIDIEAARAELSSLIVEKNGELSSSYPGIELGDEVYAKGNELYREIEQATTKSELNAIRKKIEEEYFPLAEKAALSAYMAAIKKDINDMWQGYAQSVPSYELLKNQCLYVADLCKTEEQAKAFYRDVFKSLENALQNAEYGNSWNAGYTQLTYVYVSLFNEQIIEAARKKAGISDNFVDYLKGAATLSEADERFREIRNAIESLSGTVYVEKAEASGKTYFEIKEGATSGDLVKQIISEYKITLYYSDGTTKVFAPTSDTVNVVNVDFNKKGVYFATIRLSVGEYENSFDVTVCVAPDMERAGVIGHYRSAGYFADDSDKGGELSVTLYDNGYVKFDKRYNGYFAYTDKNDYIEIEFDGQAEFGTGLFAIDGKTKTIDYYRPEGAPIIELDGTQVNLPVFVAVFGEYSVAGRYVAISNYGQTYGDAGYSFGWPTYCTLDIANKKFSMNWIKSNEEGETYTWDDGVSPYLLRADLAEIKEKAKEQIRTEWNALVAKGYDVSYWQEMTGGAESYVFQVEIATSKYSIEELLSSFDMTVKQIKSNKIRELKGEFVVPELYKGDDIEEYIKKNIVGQKLFVVLEYGSTYIEIIITRDMVTYEGSTDEYSQVSFNVKYVSELYGEANFAFSVGVMFVPEM